MLPQLSVPPGEGPLDPAALFSGDCQEIWLEIGFGAGGHLACQALANPLTGIIGCEVYENGVTNLLTRIAATELSNIRICYGDARLLLPRLPEQCLMRVFVLFPDPWPKKRHQKRRFISPATLDALARVMRPGAVLRFASDSADYCRWTEALFSAHPWFDGPVDAGGGLIRPDASHSFWPRTKYEDKAIAAGRSPLYLCYTRRNCPKLPETA